MRQEHSAVFRYLAALLAFRRDHKYRITLDGAGWTEALYVHRPEELPEASDALLEGATALRAPATLVVTGDGPVRQSRIPLLCEGEVELVTEGGQDTSGREDLRGADVELIRRIVDVLPHAEFRDEPGPGARRHLGFRVRDQLLCVINGVAHEFPLCVRLRPPKQVPQASYAVFTC